MKGDSGLSRNPTAGPRRSRSACSNDPAGPIYGLKAALKLKTQGTRWRVEVVRGTPEELRDDLSTPVLLRMRLSQEPSPAGRLLGWTGLVAEPGHAVVLYKMNWLPVASCREFWPHALTA